MNVQVTHTPERFTLQGVSGPVRTPGGVPLVIPNEALAVATAREFANVEAPVNPAALRLARIACLALDRVTTDRAQFAADIAAYGQSDLLLFRADHPQELATRQAQGWDPVLAWVGRELDLSLAVSTGVVAAPQPEHAAQVFATAVDGFDAFSLAALAEVVTLTGSLILGLALSRGHLSADQVWHLAIIDEIWQMERWGEDAEAMDAMNIRRDALLAADTCLRHLGYPQSANPSETGA